MRISLVAGSKVVYRRGSKWVKYITAYTDINKPAVEFNNRLWFLCSKLIMANISVVVKPWESTRNTKSLHWSCQKHICICFRNCKVALIFDKVLLHFYYLNYYYSTIVMVPLNRNSLFFCFCINFPQYLRCIMQRI